MQQTEEEKIKNSRKQKGIEQLRTKKMTKLSELDKNNFCTRMVLCKFVVYVVYALVSSTELTSAKGCKRIGNVVI